MRKPKVFYIDEYSLGVNGPTPYRKNACILLRDLRMFIPQMKDLYDNSLYSDIDWAINDCLHSIEKELMAEKENWKLQCDLEVEYNLDKIKTEFDLERKNLNI